MVRPSVTEANLTKIVSRLGELSLEAVYGLDRGRIDPVEDGQVDAHEVSEQHQRQHPAERTLAAREHQLGGDAHLPERARGQLDPLLDPRVLVGVVKEDAGERRALAAPLPAADLV